VSILEADDLVNGISCWLPHS